VPWSSLRPLHCRPQNLALSQQVDAPSENVHRIVPILILNAGSIEYRIVIYFEKVMQSERLSLDPGECSVPDGELIRRLARFRYHLRQFLRFSEKAARASGLTPQQHQLLLGVAGHTGRGWANIGELAEFLQERHNAVVGLVDRAAGRGLVRKVPGEGDRRFVCVHLTPLGADLLAQLSQAHREEAGRLVSRVLAAGAPTGRSATRRRLANS
jgi:DNA-binding MarR family transcriptional regulator